MKQLFGWIKDVAGEIYWQDVLISYFLCDKNIRVTDSMYHLNNKKLQNVKTLLNWNDHNFRYLWKTLKKLQIYWAFPPCMTYRDSFRHISISKLWFIQTLSVILFLYFSSFCFNLSSILCIFFTFKYYTF